MSYISGFNTESSKIMSNSTKFKNVELNSKLLLWTKYDLTDDQ